MRIGAADLTLSKGDFADDCPVEIELWSLQPSPGFRQVLLKATTPHESEEKSIACSPLEGGTVFPVHCNGRDVVIVLIVKHVIQGNAVIDDQVF